jgi:hypothetical protein
MARQKTLASIPLFSTEPLQREYAALREYAAPREYVALGEYAAYFEKKDEKKVTRRSRRILTGLTDRHQVF